MAEIRMPEPPKKHYWRVEKRIGAGWLNGVDRIKVSLVRKGRFPLYIAEIAEWDWCDWQSRPEDNAENAALVASRVLAKFERRGNSDLNGLTGYVWGGASR